MDIFHSKRIRTTPTVRGFGLRKAGRALFTCQHQQKQSVDQRRSVGLSPKSQRRRESLGLRQRRPANRHLEGRSGCSLFLCVAFLALAGCASPTKTEGWPNQIPAVTVHVTNRREICRLTTRLHQRHTEERQCLRLTTRDTPTSTTTRRQGVHLVLRIRMVRLQNLHDQQRLQGNQTHQIPQRTLNGSGSKSRINRTKIPV
ncbi:hypothetical protein GA0061078_0284 [Bifidobacterium bohemicum]|uniref:Uncharacterized protein n=1 Tax=Bifidobacterium bohemicum DSM 22767 TaxID=1437606 RepID=A0A086ZJ41_9BIFI|nr:hypothetical protein BBOH_0010 [Bifidobacterium bohemicum DSM 22767]SCB74576.1 hypothetical protein GA0061078_0284 [Bifidobacterium bohemicum]